MCIQASLKDKLKDFKDFRKNVKHYVFVGSGSGSEVKKTLPADLDPNYFDSDPEHWSIFKCCGAGAARNKAGFGYLAGAGAGT